MDWQNLVGILIGSAVFGMLYNISRKMDDTVETLKHIAEMLSRR